MTANDGVNLNAPLHGAPARPTLPCGGTAMKTRFVLVAVAALTACATLATTSPLPAQDTVQQSETGFFVQTSGGVPALCGFEFMMLYLDRTYRDGRLAGVTGSLSWSESEGNLGLLLKLVGLDFSDAAKLDTSAKPFPVLQGFVAIDGKAQLPKTTFICEARTNFCGGYGLPTSAEIFSNLSSGKLSLGFAREANGLDITLPLNARDGVKASPNDFLAFTSCVDALVARAQKNLGK